MSKKRSGKNLGLAGIFILFVFVLIVISTLFKFFLIIRDSKFDGTHRFVVAFIERNGEKIVSFSPENKSISMLKVDAKIDRNILSKTLEIPIDGVIDLGSQSLNENNVSSVLLRNTFPFGHLHNGLNMVDSFRLFLFARTVSLNSVYIREFSSNFNESQKSTILSLTFTDPTIYRENLSIQVINTTQVFGLGTRLATFITNIGGNVVLVSTSEETSRNSKITYYKNKSYTVSKLSSYLGIAAEESDQRGVADVIITIGTDKVSVNNF